MNKKIYVVIVFIIILAVLGILFKEHSVAPTISNNSPVEQEGWQSVDADFFTIQLPTNWSFNKLQGKDSYVGEFVGDGVKLSFDFGRYSNPLVQEDSFNYIENNEVVDNYKAKIVISKLSNQGITGIYFGDLGNESKLTLVGSDLSDSQKEIALKIFRSIKFKK